MFMLHSYSVIYFAKFIKLNYSRTKLVYFNSESNFLRYSYLNYTLEIIPYFHTGNKCFFKYKYIYVSYDLYTSILTKSLKSIHWYIHCTKNDSTLWMLKQRKCTIILQHKCSHMRNAVICFFSQTEWCKKSSTKIEL